MIYTKNNTISAQEKFVRDHKRYHHKVSFARAFIFFSFLLLWEAASRLGWIDSFFFSGPSRIVYCFYDLLMKKNLMMHITITLLETLVSFFLVLGFGILTAMLLWYFPKVADVAEPYFVILNSLPKSALAPLFIVWLGTGSPTIIVAGISVAIFGSVISLYTGFKQADSEKIILIYTLGGSKRAAFSKVVFPGSIPTILSTMKINIGLALVGVIIGEFLAARKGLGYLIIYGSQTFQLDMVITSIIILCFFAMTLYQIIQKAEHYYKKHL